MRKMRGLIGTAIGALVAIGQQLAPWSHHSIPTDQAAIAPYLVPTDGPESDLLRQLVASRYQLTPQTIGSNIVRTATENVTTSERANWA